MGRSFVLNVSAAAAGLGGPLFITWNFGLAEFAYFTINTAKLSLILLGAELLPSSFTIFRLQEDQQFTGAVPVFYSAFAGVATALAAGLISLGVVSHWSWFMLLFVFNSALQRYFDTQAQASGRVDAYFWIPAATNISRLVLLAGLSQFRFMSVEDILWASTAVGGIVGQVVMLSRFPELFDCSVYRRPLGKIAYLWSLRVFYYGYYGNSVLKRFRDIFLPLFCDLVFPSKGEIGRLFVFTRANEAVCGQVRVLEAFMVNRAIREDIRGLRRRIFWVIAPVGQVAVATLALILMYPHGIGLEDVVLALCTGFFIYAYILELYWRNDALAAFRPRQVTISLATFLATLAVPPLLAWATGTLSIPVLVASYVLSQTFAALTYRLFRLARPTPKESQSA
jgi:hypothetical protein